MRDALEKIRIVARLAARSPKADPLLDDIGALATLATMPLENLSSAPNMVVVAWKPTAEELAALNAGAPVFLTTLGGLPPHFITTDFAAATTPS
jgi:hypothetical protein